MIWLYIWIGLIAGFLGGVLMEFKHGKLIAACSLLIGIIATVIAVINTTLWALLIPLIWLIGLYIGIVLYALIYEKRIKE